MSTTASPMPTGIAPTALGLTEPDILAALTSNDAGKPWIQWIWRLHKTFLSMKHGACPMQHGESARKKKKTKLEKEVKELKEQLWRWKQYRNRWTRKLHQASVTTTKRLLNSYNKYQHCKHGYSRKYPRCTYKEKYENPQMSSRRKSSTGRRDGYGKSADTDISYTQGEKKNKTLRIHNKRQHKCYFTKNLSECNK